MKRTAPLLLFLFSSLAQPPPSPAPIKVTTHLVQVNVVVHGKKNDAVADLAKNDFTILDNGQPQQIATFAMESGRPADIKPAKFVLPLNTFTNRTEIQPAAPKAVTVILLDMLNTRFEDQVQAKKQL